MQKSRKQMVMGQSCIDLVFADLRASVNCPFPVGYTIVHTLPDHKVPHKFLDTKGLCHSPD